VREREAREREEEVHLCGYGCVHPSHYRSADSAPPQPQEGEPLRLVRLTVSVIVRQDEVEEALEAYEEAFLADPAQYRDGPPVALPLLTDEIPQKADEFFRWEASDE